MLLFVVTCSAPRPLFIPSRSEGPSAAQLSTSASTPTPVGYPLCFDNDPFCLSPNPFLLITIWIAYVGTCFCPVLAPLFRSLCKEKNASPIFSIVSALLAQNTRVCPNCSLPRRLSARGQNGTAAPLSRLRPPSSTSAVNVPPLTLSTRFSSLPLHTFSP